MRATLRGVAMVGAVVCLSGCSTSSTSDTLLGPHAPATRTAEAILYYLNRGNLSATVPIQGCTSVTSGHIGPLEAPYSICPISTPIGHFVSFRATKSTVGYGITFTDRGPETFLDACYQHLVGKWYETQDADLSNPAAPCSGAWKFHGGP